MTRVCVTNVPSGVLLVVAALLCGAGAASGGPLDNKMALLWGTPILSRQLVPDDPGARNDENNPNVQLRRALLESFEQFKRTEWKGSRSSSQFHGLNDAFFRYQLEHFRSSGTNFFKMYPVVGALLGQVETLVKRYLQAAGYRRSEDDLAARPVTTEVYKKEDPAPLDRVRIFMWAAIHDSCMAHMPHTHPNATVSGVYYVNVPEGSGDLFFEDPRGALPPFGNRHIVKPQAGKILLFPPWLVHGVAPSCGVSSDNPRISLSFNVLGDWARTNDATALLFDMENSPPRREEL